MGGKFPPVLGGQLGVFPPQILEVVPPQRGGERKIGPNWVFPPKIRGFPPNILGGKRFRLGGKPIWRRGVPPQNGEIGKIWGGGNSSTSDLFWGGNGAFGGEHFENVPPQKWGGNANYDVTFPDFD